MTNNAHHSANSTYNYNPDECDISQNHIIKGRDYILNSLLNTPAASHNIIVYPDIRILRRTYPVYIKSLLDNNQIVLVLTYYDHPSIIRQAVAYDENNNDGSLVLERHIRDRSLVMLDSVMSHEPQHNDERINKLNFLSLIRIMLNHGIKNNKNGVNIFLDMGVFFHFGYCHSKNYNIVQNILEYEKSIPVKYRELEFKTFCLYHQRDYESHFRSTRQRAQLFRCHEHSVVVLENNNDRSNNINDNNNLIRESAQV